MVGELDAAWQFITSQGSVLFAIAVFTGAALAILLAMLKILDGRYPRIKFLVMEKGRFWFAMRRLDKIKVISDDIFSLITTKNPVGEDINHFQDVYMDKGVVYLATMVGSILHPTNLDLDAKHLVEYDLFDAKGSFLRKEKRELPLILPEEVINGARLGARYRETMIATQDLTLAQQPLLVAIAVAIPISVILGFFLLASWLTITSTSDSVGKLAGQVNTMLGQQLQLAGLQNTTANTMQQVTANINSTMTGLGR